MFKLSVTFTTAISAVTILKHAITTVRKLEDIKTVTKMLNRLRRAYLDVKDAMQLKSEALSEEKALAGTDKVKLAKFEEANRQFQKEVNNANDEKISISISKEERDAAISMFDGIDWKTVTDKDQINSADILNIADFVDGLETAEEIKK